MGVPISQVWTVAKYVLERRLRGDRRYPLVLMLEPLFRCNLACGGCGKIQHPAEILRRNLSPEECFRAVDECPAPIVSIPGGEPLLHPQIHEIVEGLVERKKYVYLCTNGLLLSKHLHRFQPSKYLTFSVHIDGTREDHDRSVCREGVYDTAIEAIRQAVKAGFRVTTNSTFFNDAEPERVQAMFEELSQLGLEGMMISPGYQYEKAPDQEHFLKRRETVQLFRDIFARPKRTWKFNHSPLFLEFLQGRWDLKCTPWGNPTYNVFGWQKPCYLLQEGTVGTFRELMTSTDWDTYGHESGNPKCRDCMVHSGYEPTAVMETFGSVQGMMASAWVALFGRLPERKLSASAAGVSPRKDRPADVPELVTLDLPISSDSEAAGGCGEAAQREDRTESPFPILQ